MDSRSLGIFIAVTGVLAVIVGALLYSGAISWFGRLPGDIRYEGDRTGIYVPITSMILVSIVLSLVMYLVRRFL